MEIYTAVHKLSSHRIIWFYKSVCSSDPLEVFVAEFVEEDVGPNDVNKHLHMHTVCRDVAALWGTQHISGVPVRQLLRTEPLVHVPIGLPRITDGQKT